MDTITQNKVANLMQLNKIKAKRFKYCWSVSLSQNNIFEGSVFCLFAGWFAAVADRKKIKVLKLKLMYV